MSDFYRQLITGFYAYSRMMKTLKDVKRYEFNQRLAWREMRINYRVRKKYHIRYVPLGFDCLVRTVLTNWMLKPDRRCGEKGMPFDRAMHPSKMLADSLEKNFSDFFENWCFNPAPELNCWFNRSQLRNEEELPTLFLKARNEGNAAFYYHDRDCGPGDFEKIRKRTELRLSRFLDTLTHPRENDLFILNKRLNESPAEIERVCRLIREKRKSASTHILVLVTEAADPVQKIEGAVLIRCIYPYNDTFWGNHNRHRRLHVFFEMKIARACRKYITENF